MNNQQKNKHHYINNEDFLNALIDYKNLLEDSVKTSSPKPKIPEYIRRMFL